MRYLLTILLCITVTSNLQASSRFVISNNYTNDFSCSVKLNEEKKSALFEFNLNLDKSAIIEWNKEEIEINNLEYSWLVYIESSNSEIGYYYFKHKGKKIRGTYNELFNVGQISIFKDGNNIIDYDNPNKPTVKLIDGKIILEINYFKIYSTLFKKNSNRANFWILGSNINPSRCKTVINQKYISIN